MRIGIDFDNTIVSYDALFHKVAREQDAVPAETPVDKVAVRDHLRRIGREEVWTEMQGYVYGARMAEAEAFDGVIDFIRDAVSSGHHVYIVSHKTRHPFIGPQYDLHRAAREWIENRLLYEGNALLPAGNIHFELTKQEKIARIGAIGCDVFVDDLPEILLFENFPSRTERLLFDPEGNHGQIESIGSFGSWRQISEHFNLG